MFRSVIARSTPIAVRGITARTVMAPTMTSMRFYSPPSNLSKENVTNRVIDVIKSFNKTGTTTDITASSSFQKDLGLDSLDTVELIVAIEEEFSVEIPDKVADDLKTVSQTVDYIKNETDAS